MEAYVELLPDIILHSQFNFFGEHQKNRKIKGTSYAIENFPDEFIQQRAEVFFSRYLNSNHVDEGCLMNNHCYHLIDKDLIMLVSLCACVIFILF